MSPSLAPNYLPAVLSVKPKQKHYWRLANTFANFILNIEIRYDGVLQDICVVAVDGYPLTKLKTQPGIIQLGPGGRIEFILKTPHTSMNNCTISGYTTLGAIITPFRTYINIVASHSAPKLPITIPMPHPPPPKESALANDPGASLPLRTAGSPPVMFDNPFELYEEVLHKQPDNIRNMYFKGEFGTPLMIGVEGYPQKSYTMDDPPIFTIYDDVTEDWIVENHSKENHVFHIHQGHFLLLSRNGVSVKGNGKHLQDTVIVYGWSGHANESYPNVRIRLDFTHWALGTFMFHCHILNHEDNGMMLTMVLKHATNGTVYASAQPPRSLSTEIAQSFSAVPNTLSSLNLSGISLHVLWMFVLIVAVCGILFYKHSVSAAKESNLETKKMIPQVQV